MAGMGSKSTKRIEVEVPTMYHGQGEDDNTLLETTVWESDVELTGQLTQSPLI